MAQRGSVAMVIGASPDGVFRLVTDVERLPAWNALIMRVVEPLVDLAPGREWVVEMRAMGNTWHSRSRVLECDAESRRFSYRSCTDDGNPSYGDWTWQVDPDAGSDGARVVVSWELHPRTFWRRTLMAPMRSHQLRGEVRTSLQAVEECLTRAGKPLMSRVHPLHDDALANTSYLVEVGDARGVVIDPPRDVDAHVELAARLGLEIVATFDTHVHADYVSGATELIARGADAYVPRGAEPTWPHRSIDDDERIAISDAVFHALATPGHTPEHMAYLLEVDGRPLAVFSGGSLILGGAARTDLLGENRAEELARAQFHSLRRLAALPDDVALHPTHGAGSFCLATATTTANPTIGSERATNPLLAIDDEDEFVKVLLAGFGSFPTYYRSLQALNESGPTPLANLDAPPLLSPHDAAGRLARGAWLIDARPVHEWAKEHPVGAVSNELRPAFASWLGWIVPFGAPIVLLLDEDQRAEAVRLAHRIGYDDLAFLDGGIDAWRAAGLPVASIDELTAREAFHRQQGGATLLDVRQDSELPALRIPGAEHAELGDIIAGTTPPGTQLIVFCGHGERSASAASLLERRGIPVANLVGGTAAWVEDGLPVES